MKQNLLSAGRRSLIAQLGKIIPGNGYRTDAGTRVKSGWFNELVKPETSGFPMIVVQKSRDLDPVPKPGALLAQSGFHVIGAVDVGHDNYEDALEDLEHDVLCCLMPEHQQFLAWAPRGVTGIVLGAPQAFPPGDGMKCATFLLPVYLKTIIERG